LGHAGFVTPLPGSVTRAATCQTRLIAITALMPKQSRSYLTLKGSVIASFWNSSSRSMTRPHGIAKATMSERATARPSSSLTTSNDRSHWIPLLMLTRRDFGLAKWSQKWRLRVPFGRQSWNIRTIWNAIQTVTPAISSGRTGSFQDRRKCVRQGKRDRISRARRGNADASAGWAATSECISWLALPRLRYVVVRVITAQARQLLQIAA
jgi:hypothetical protein